MGSSRPYFEKTTNIDCLANNFNTLVFFDTETTGLSPKDDRIIEVACKIVDRCDIYKADEVNITDEHFYVELPDGMTVPDDIHKLTGITDATLRNCGHSEKEVAQYFAGLIQHPKTLLIAHNAKFDISFMKAMMKRHHTVWYGALEEKESGTNLLNAAFYLDTLAVFRTRKKAPKGHKLSDAVHYYGLDGSVKNSHRAMDDVDALYEVCKAMGKEAPNLSWFVRPCSMLSDL